MDIAAETESVGKKLREFLGDAIAEPAIFGRFGIGFEGGMIERAQPHTDLQSFALGLNSLDDFAREARAVFEAAAKRAGARVGAEKFVTEISVAMFDIDKLIPDALREFCRGDVFVDQPAKIVIGEENRIIFRGNMKFAIENRMMIGNLGIEPLFVVGPAKAATVRELQSDEKIIRFGELLAMGVQKRMK